MSKQDNVNHPSHYNQGNIECIAAIDEATKGLQGSEAFYIGNAIKYLWRWKHKNGVEDLEKARNYLDKLIKKERGGTAGARTEETHIRHG